MPATLDRRSNNSWVPANRTDENLSDRITKFRTYIGNQNLYRVPLRFLSDPGLVIQLVKLDLKIICSLETKISKLFESNRQVLTFPTRIQRQK